MKPHRRGHGEGTIGRRSDGRWMARVDLGWKDGKRVRKAVYGHTQEEVRQKLTKELRNRDLGVLPRSGASPTLRRFLTDWLNSVKSSVRVRSWEKYTGVVNKHLIPDLGPVRLEKLTPQRVQALLDAKLAAGLHPTSVGAIRLVLRQALHQAVRWEMIPRNVVDVVSPPKVHRHEWTPLKPEQARALLAASQGEPFGALYLLALSTGMRRGELLGLKWEDIELETGALSVRRSLQRTSPSGLVFEEPKTRQGRRTIHLSPATIAALKAHRRRQAETRLRVGAHWKDNDLLFPSGIGTPLDPHNLALDFNSTLEKAGLSHVRFHDLRHSAATLALSQGIHPKVVAEMLGHSRISLTLDVYSHSLPNLQAEAADKMSALLS